MIDTITSDMKAAMKSGDKTKLGCLRMLLSEIKNLQIEKGGVGSDIPEGDLLALLKREVKKRRESAATYRDAGREETAEKEEQEAAIIEAYLPQQITGAELEKLVNQAIEETGAASKKQMGAVMGKIMSTHQGRVDGKEVQQLVMKKLP